MRDLVYSRELRLNELIAIGFRMFLGNFKTILFGLVIICLPISVLSSLIQTRMAGTLNIMNAISEAQYAVSNAEMIQVLQRYTLENLLIIAVSVFLEPIFTIGVAKAVKARLEGREVNRTKVFSDALLLEGTIVQVGFVYAVLVFLGSLILFPGIFMAVNWMFYVYCIGLCDRKGMDALRHSKDLVRGRWWKTFGYLIVLYMVGIFWNMMIQMAFLPFGEGFVVNTVYTLVTYLTNGFLACVITIFFLNRESGLFGMRDLQQEEFTVIDGVAQERSEETENQDENKTE